VLLLLDSDPELPVAEDEPEDLLVLELEEFMLVLLYPPLLYSFLSVLDLA